MSQAATVAAALAAKAKPVVNIDRILEQPPKRKPGRPAKHQTGTQSRGPGRPKKEKNVESVQATKENPCPKKAKVIVSQCSQEKESIKIEGVTQEEKIDRRIKARKSIFIRKGDPLSTISTKQSATKQQEDAKVCLKRKKCLNKPAQQISSVGGKRCKETNSADEPVCKRIKRDKRAAKKASRKSKSTERSHLNPG